MMMSKTAISILATWVFLMVGASVLAQTGPPPTGSTAYIEFIPELGSSFYQMRKGDSDALPDDNVHKPGPGGGGIIYVGGNPLCIKKDGSFRFTWRDTTPGTQQWKINSAKIYSKADPDNKLLDVSNTPVMNEGDLYPPPTEDPINVWDYIELGIYDIKILAMTGVIDPESGEEGFEIETIPLAEIYVVLDAPEKPMEDPWVAVVQWATGAARLEVNQQSAKIELERTLFFIGKFLPTSTGATRNRTETSEEFLVKDFMASWIGRANDFSDFLLCAFASVGIDSAKVARTYTYANAKDSLPDQQHEYMINAYPAWQAGVGVPDDPFKLDYHQFVLIGGSLVFDGAMRFQDRTDPFEYQSAGSWSTNILDYEWKYLVGEYLKYVDDLFSFAFPPHDAFGRDPRAPLPYPIVINAQNIFVRVVATS